MATQEQASVVIQDGLFSPRGRVTRCAICGRRLSNPNSVERGIGPVCAGGHHADLQRDQADEIKDEFLFGMPLKECGLVVRRRDGRVQTNVPHTVVHHSPSGYEFGYSGSGPADLALNAMEHILHTLGHGGPTMPCYDGRCLALAWRLHQEFKRAFIAPMDREQGGIVPWATIQAWVQAHIAQDDEREHISLLAEAAL